MNRNCELHPHWAVKSIYFSISVHYSISNTATFRALYLHSGGGMDNHLHPLSVLYKTEISTTFIWNFFAFNRYVRQRSAQGKSIFAFLYIIVFRTKQSLELPSSTPVEDGHRRLLSVLYETEISTTFIWNFFAYNQYFQQHSAPKLIYFHISIHYSISDMAIFRYPISILGGDRHVRSLSFFVGNWNLNNFYLKLFCMLIIYIFLKNSFFT